MGTCELIPAVSAAKYISNPTTLPGVVGWYDANQMIADGNAASDGDAVASWTDHGTLGQPLVQASAPARPLFKTNQIFGHPAVRFDGTASILKTATFASQALPYSVFLVCKFLGSVGGADAKLWGQDTTKRHEISKKVTTGYWAFFQSDVGTERVSTTPLDANTHVVLGRWVTNATAGLFVDGGTPVASGAMTGTAPMIQRTLGGYPGDSNYAQIDVPEVVIMTSPSVANENLVGAYLAGRYGLNWATVT